MRRIRSHYATQRLNSSGRFDLVVQHGLECTLPAKVRYVTWEDSTLVQALRDYDWPFYESLSSRDVRRNLAQQREVYLRAAGCCAMTEPTARSIVEDYGINPDRVHVVGVGANTEVSDLVAREWAKPEYLFVGSDWVRKNGPRVLAAFLQIRRSVPEARLHLVGDHPLVTDPGVTCHGQLDLATPAQRDSLRSLFSRSTVLVVPSLWEPAGIVYAEAARAGIGSIASTNGGAITMVGDAGLLIDPEKDDALRDAMLRFAQPRFAQEMGARAAARADTLTWKAVAERLIRAAQVPDLNTSTLADFL